MSTIIRCAACFAPIILASGLGNTDDTWVHADMLSVLDGHDAVVPVEDDEMIESSTCASCEFLGRACRAHVEVEPITHSRTCGLFTFPQTSCDCGANTLAAITGWPAPTLADPIDVDEPEVTQEVTTPTPRLPDRPYHSQQARDMAKGWGATGIDATAFRATLVGTSNPYLVDRLPLEGLVRIGERDVVGGPQRVTFLPDAPEGESTSFVHVADAVLTFRSNI